MEARRRIGDLLAEAGAVGRESLAYALKIQAHGGGRLGDTLQSLRFVTDTEVARVVAQQHGLPYSELDAPTPPEVLKLIPFAFAQRHLILPLVLEKGSLVLAVEDPDSTTLQPLVSRFVSHPIRLAVAPRARLAREIQRRYFRAEHPVDQEVERMAQTIGGGREFAAERLIELLISSAIDSRASDIHLGPTPLASVVSFRIDGVLGMRYALPAAAHQRVVSTCKVMSGMDIADQNRAQDGRMSFDYLDEKYDLRVATMPGVNGENLVIRVLAGNNELFALDDLGYSEAQIAQVDRMTRCSHGAVLATGPTGSGKTTTLFAMLRRIDMLSRNVLTVEDPVEFRIPLARQMEVNERAGVTFASAIRAFLRQDPDVILVGEIRDEETAQLTLRAAQTGHMVLSTVHTNDAVGAIVRLRDLGVQDFALSASLAGVVAQRLVRRLCLQCRQPVAPGTEHANRYGPLPELIYEHAGCDRCHGSGYAGRIAVAEVLELDDDLRVMVERGEVPTAIERRAREKGMVTLLQSGLALVARGVTDLAELERVI